MDTTTTIIFFYWKKTDISGLVFPVFILPVKHMLPSYSDFLSLRENTIKNWRSPKTNAARIKTSATGAAVLNNPVHILIQALCIAVCHPTDIVCHQKQAEIQLLCLALSFCLITVSLFIVI